MTSYIGVPKSNAIGSPGASCGVSGQRPPSLAGLRFAATLLVLGLHIRAMHVFWADSAGQRIVGHLFGHGTVGVSFVFILSGFVFAWPVRATELARRIWRRAIGCGRDLSLGGER